MSLSIKWEWPKKKRKELCPNLVVMYASASASTATERKRKQRKQLNLVYPCLYILTQPVECTLPGCEYESFFKSTTTKNPKSFFFFLIVVLTNWKLYTGSACCVLQQVCWFELNLELFNCMNTSMWSERKREKERERERERVKLVWIFRNIFTFVFNRLKTNLFLT